MNVDDLKLIAASLVSPGKGILAADESAGTIKKRFESIGVESNPENNRIYRQLLFKTPKIEEFISGVIMFDETVRQITDEGVPFPKYLQEKGILPGIKVDKGKVDMPNFPGETITEGIDGLKDRLIEYREMGLVFTKWRAAFSVKDELPSQACIDSNAELLARFAAYSQEAGLVPIVEPEVLMEGDHTLEEFSKDNKRVLKEVFIHLEKHKVDISRMLLKPSWMHGGIGEGKDTESEDVARETLKVFKEILPDELPGVVFLSGGDGPQNSTAHLNMLNKIGGVPWQLSFSFGRALQEPVLRAWGGKMENIENAQKEFYKRARLNSLARSGKYENEMENGNSG